MPRAIGCICIVILIYILGFAWTLCSHDVISFTLNPAWIPNSVFKLVKPGGRFVFFNPIREGIDEFIYFLRANGAMLTDIRRIHVEWSPSETKDCPNPGCSIIELLFVDCHLDTESDSSEEGG